VWRLSNGYSKGEDSDTGEAIRACMLALKRWYGAQLLLSAPLPANRFIMDHPWLKHRHTLRRYRRHAEAPLQPATTANIGP
jgi:hypothetical protein